MILTSYLYVGVHYKTNNGVSSKLAPVSTCCWKQWTDSPLLPTAACRINRPTMNYSGANFAYMISKIIDVVYLYTDT
jgi:hypothetical protein